MKLNNRGSFTVEASIVVVIVFLIVLMLVKSYILQFAIHYGRKLQLLSNDSYQLAENGWYIDQYEKERSLEGLTEIPISLKTYQQDLNYLKLMHHYLLLDEFGEVINEAIEKY